MHSASEMTGQTPGQGDGSNPSNSTNREYRGVPSVTSDPASQNVSNSDSGRNDSAQPINIPTRGNSTREFDHHPEPTNIPQPTRSRSELVQEEEESPIPLETLNIPRREQRPYAYSSSVPKETFETLSLISIMANKIPLESLSTKSLRLILLQEHVSTAGILEKRDLIAKVQTLIDNVRGDINNLNNDEMLCRVCVDNVINCVLLECGHYTMCIECAQAVYKSSRECPICRQTITRIVHTFRT
jgi:hypothetical protein